MDQQEIYLEPNQDGSSFALNKSHIQVHTCRTYETARDSGNVKTTALVDYRWEVKVYSGNLVAVHRDGEVLAYILHGAPSRTGCAVRVYHRSTKNRALIKGFTGQAVDLSWAFTVNPLYLAVVDEGGHLFVYRIQCKPNEITVQKFFHLKRNDDLLASPRLSHRVVWCPYVADDTNDDSLSSSGAGDVKDLTDTSLKSCGLMAIAYGDNVDVVDLEPLIEKHGHEVDVESLTHGFATFTSRGNILSLTLSPDATALAVATQSGEVIFYIMETLNDIREAHHWSPHKGRPVTTIVFLDDVTDAGKDVHFWKFALTAADNNRELKLWNCETWDCFSTLRIEAPNAHMDHSMPLLLTMDWTANYLFLSDIERKSLYVVQMTQNNGQAKYVSFSEFPLVQPALSLAVVDASKKRFRPFSPGGCSELDRSDDGEDDVNKVVGVRASLYAVNPKSLLELEIRFQPNVPDVNDNNLSSSSSLKFDSFHDQLSDLSVDVVVPPPPSDLARALMSADDFTRNTTKKLQPLVSNSPTESVTPVGRTPTKDIDNGRQISNSPSSQEVRTILSHSVPRDDETYTSASGLEAMESERPVTPVAHTLEVVGTPTMANVWRKSVSSSKLSDSEGPAASLPSVGHLLDAVTKLSMQVERVVAHMQRQEDQLLQLKSALNGQSDVFAQMASAVQTSEQQIKNSDDVLRSCQMHVQSFRSDQFKQNLNQTIQESVQRTLEAIVKSEMRTTIASILNDSMNKVKEGMQNEISQKLTVADALLRENIGKMVKSKPVVDAIGQSAGQAIANEAHAAYKQAFQSVVVPSFESASRNLFTQMNEIFRKGTSEYLEQLQRQLTSARASNDELKVSVVTHMTNMNDQMLAMFDKQAAALTTHVQNIVEKQLQQSSSKTNETNLHTMRQMVKEEMSRALADNQQTLNDAMLRVLRSQAATPIPSSPHVDRQQMQKELSALLQQNNFSAAFQQALSATDLSLVTYVCSKVPPTQIFSMTPCPLQQPVILSLIQQLSTDLSSQTELKIKYLQDAIPSIDPKAPGLTGQGIQRVIGQLHQSLNSFLQNPSSAPYSRQIKFLTMAAQSLIN